VKLALDHLYTTAIAIQLRERDHDAVAAVEQGWETETDESLLVMCEAQLRALVTNDVGDFTVIARQWAVEGRRHAGLVFTSDASMPRSPRTMGRYVDTLDDLLRSHPEDGSFIDRSHWL